MKYYNIYITLVFFVKIIFILLALTHIFIKLKGKENSTLDKKIEYWKERVEFVFVVMMSLLLIYIFSPRVRTTTVDGETKILLYLFGFVLLITAKWEDFFHEAKWVYFLRKTLGDVGSR